LTAAQQAEITKRQRELDEYTRQQQEEIDQLLGPYAPYETRPKQNW
jgi:hypothetical protein